MVSSNHLSHNNPAFAQLYGIKYSYQIQMIFEVVLPFWSMKMYVKGIKQHTTLPRPRELKPHHQIPFSVIPRHPFLWSLTSLKATLSAYSKPRKKDG